MLFLGPPAAFHEGVQLYRDHADPLTWYYVPKLPRLAWIDGKPQFVLRKFTGEGGGGAILDFAVDLGLADDVRESLRAHARRLVPASAPSGTVRLLPLPVVAGSKVRLVLLGGAKGGFVRSGELETTPALYGDNLAIFSLRLDPTGAKLVEDQLDPAAGALGPIGVVYELRYQALRPSYQISATAKWSKLHRELRKGVTGESVLLGLDIDKRLRELEDERTIELHGKDFVPGAKDGSDAYTAAMASVRALVVDRFFTPTKVPPPPDKPRQEPSMWDGLGRFAETLVRASSSLGLSTWGAYTLRKVDIDDSDQTELQVDLDEQVAREETLYPQGFLTHFADAARAAGAQIITTSHLDDDDFYKRRTVTVLADVDLAAEGIREIGVELTYGDQTREVYLRAPGVAPKEPVLDKASWNSRGGRTMVRDVTARYTLHFEPRAGLPTELAAPPRTITTNAWTLSPRELYGLKTVRFGVKPGFPWDRYHRVDVQVRYRDPVRGVELDGMLSFSPPTTTPDGRGAPPTQDWRIFYLGPRALPFSYRVIYRGAVDREEAWVDSELTWIELGDPAAGAWRFTVRALPTLWKTYSLVDVELSYEAADGPRREAVSFDADSPRSQVVAIEAPRGVVDYRTTFFRADGAEVTVPPSREAGEILTVGPAMTGKWVVRVRPAPGDLAGKRIERIEVTLRHREGATVAPPTAITLRRPDDVAFFGYAYTTEEVGGFEYEAMYWYESGFSYATEVFQVGRVAELLVPLVAQ